MLSAVEWIETWSAGNAVLQGMGLEITSDLLFFDLLDVLRDKGKHSFSAHTRTFPSIQNQRVPLGAEEEQASPVQALYDKGFPRVLRFHFLHQRVQLVVQLQHKRPGEHSSRVRRTSQRGAGV